ncbi:MAG: sulfatase, partial [Myxococcales bacterium]|nr:sulfatase [Myxococcales bacterium]
LTGPRASRSPAWRLVLAAMVVGAFVASLVMLIDVARPPARIVLIVVDTLRRDFVSVYGGAQATPNIDALAERGQVFTNAVASFHQTTMSMAALFTGRTPSIETADPSSTLSWNSDTWCGMARFAEAGSDIACIPEAVPTLAERLKEAGYWTIGVASNQFLFEPSGFGRGFDDWIEVGPRQEARPRQRPELGALRAWAPVTKAAVAAVNRRPQGRFFLYVHYMDVHDYPFAQVDYPTSIGTVDRAVGVLLNTLEKAKLLEDATVIVTSDHGERFGERHPLRGRPGHYGNPAFQELLRVPLIVAPPVVDDPTAPLRTQDLHDLIQEIAGLRPDRDGELAPGELYVGERRFRTYLDGRWKSTLRRSDGRLFLFDLENDPEEKRNVAEVSPHIAAAHRQRIEEISGGLAIRGALPKRELSAHERETLKILGYVE